METWLDVVGYEGCYQVSDYGRVKSVARISAQNHHLRERIRKPETDKDGYQIVNLCKDGKVRLHKVHRLVAMAFIKNTDNRDQINHIDGNKANNRVSNLEWVNGSENVRHALDTGLRKPTHISYYGEKNSHCKLSDLQCEEIRKMKAESKITNARLAELFRVGTSQIGRILKNKQRVKGSVSIG